MLKIKGVSELDVKLGYPKESVGSLLFKKPEPLIRFDAGEGDLGTLVNEFLQSKGFQEGTVEWQNALKRTMDRAGEWRKWEKKYKYWDDRGWVETTYNAKGNAVPNEVVPQLTAGKYEGFRLVKTGEEQFIVEMLDAKTGRFGPITGDIDPIAFTHLDGSPLTVNEHAALLEEMANNELLAGQHGESATYVDGGVDFIASQFKPNEPGLQIAPGGLAPRVVRFDKARSDWHSSFDYHLWWDGGYVYSGSYVPRGARPLPAVVVPLAEGVAKPKPMPLPASVDGAPNVGRLTITFSTVSDAVNGYIDVKGKIVNLAADGKTTTVSPLHDEAFTDNGAAPREVIVKPVTGLTKPVKVGQTELPIPEGDPWLASAGTDLHVGDTVIVGVGTDHPEAHQIIAFGSIILDSGLRYDHEAGELILLTRAAAGSSPSAAGDIASTGTDATGTLVGGTLLLLLGAGLLRGIRRRSRSVP